MSGIAWLILVGLLLSKLTSPPPGQTQASSAQAPGAPSFVGALWLGGLGVVALTAAGSMLIPFLWTLGAVWYAVLLVPGAFLRVVTSLGWTRASWFLQSLRLFDSLQDRRGGAVLAGARALLRQRPVHAESLDWLRRRLDREKPLLGAGMVALGFMALAGGDVERARRLLEMVLQVHAAAVPPCATKWAREWLALDAAVRGEWRRVHRLSRRSPLPRSRLTRFLAGASARIMGDSSAPGPVVLFLLWVLAPRRRATRAVYLRARGLPVVSVRSFRPFRPRGPRRPSPLDDAIPTDGGIAPVDRALRLHARALGASSLSKNDWRRLGEAWADALRCPETLRVLSQRAGEIEEPDPAGILADWQRAVREEIAQLLQARGDSIHRFRADAGPLGVAARVACDEMVGEIATACGILQDRVE